MKARGALSLALAAACARPAGPATRADVPARQAERTRWRLAPTLTPASRARDGFTLHGAVRAENGRPAGAPFTTSALVAAARLPDGTWRFAAADGGLYRAATFTGPLVRAGALPFALEAPMAREAVVQQGPYGEGALMVRGEDLRAHRVDAGGAVRTLPLHGVMHALSVDARTVLAITEPGTLWRSTDEGRTFAPLRPPGGIALSLWLDEGGTHVRTTAGTLAYRDGALVTDPRGLTSARSLAVAPEVSGRVRDALPRAPWGLTPGASASPDGATVLSLRGDRLVTLRARDGATLRDEPAPGTACALARYDGGVAAVCTRGWARVVLARRLTDPGWRVLRDERDAAPVGELRFDAGTGLWVSGSPCAQGRDARDVLCVTDASAVARELRAPGALLAAHDGEVLILRGGVVLALDAEGRERGRAASPNAPMGLDAWVVRGGVALIPRGPHARAAIVRSRSGWRRVAVPGDYARVTDDGTWITWSRDVSTLRASTDGGRFASLPSPVLGAPRALGLGDEALACAAGWCSLGERLTLAPEGSGDAPSLAAEEAYPIAGQRVPQRTIRCEHGPGGPAAEIDHGAASTGYAVRADPAGDALALTWEGDLLRGRARWVPPRRDAAAMEVRGVPFATTPAALLTRCDARGCDHLLATSRALTDLRLGRAVPGGVEVHAWSDGFVVRVDEVRPEASVVTLLRVDAAGALGHRRSYALAGRIDDAAAGRWGARDGLWIAGPTGAMRFSPLDGVDDVGVEVPAPDARTTPCAEGTVAEGEARWVHGAPVVRGDGWFLERGRWQHEQVLAVARGRVCALRVGGGEPFEEREGAEQREEREPVRSFVLRPEGGAWRGDAWSGRRRITLRCNATE